MTHNPENWPVIKDRVSYIQNLAAGLDVLDVGCAGKKADGRVVTATTLHQQLTPVCKSLLGVDTDVEGVRLMEKAGFHVICDNITSMQLKQKFDVIIAGEVIEHLLNPGLALKNLGTHLTHDGRLVLTTCNPFYYRQQSKILRRGKIQVHQEHTAWYDPVTIAVMLNNSGFRIAKGVWIASTRKYNGLTFLGYWRRYWNPNFLIEASLK